ncbi:MAG: alpha/beta fold hydrolase [Acidimicrobiales bacterium]
MGRLVATSDTELFVDERGRDDAFPLFVLHGGPGVDHRMFGDYLDPIASSGRYRLVLVDQRANGRSDRASPPETWTLEQMAADVSELAKSLGLARYAVLGHSYGSFVALQHAVVEPAAAAATIVSSGVASARWLARVDKELARFEPVYLREQVTESWAKEKHVTTEEEVAALISEQDPFQFADPLDPRIEEYERRSAGARFAPDVLRRFAAAEYGGIEVADRLGEVTHPVLVLAGRHDRTCCVEAAEEMAAKLPDAELVVFEDSAHMTFVEEPERYVAAVTDFLDRKL